MKYGYDVYQDDTGLWRWRLWAEVPVMKNIASSGQSFTDRATALAEAKMVRMCPGDATINVLYDDADTEVPVLRLDSPDHGYSFHEDILEKLRVNGMEFLSDLLKVTEQEVDTVIGDRKTIKALKELLADYGLSFANEPEGMT